MVYISGVPITRIWALVCSSLDRSVEYKLGCAVKPPGCVAEDVYVADSPRPIIIAGAITGAAVGSPFVAGDGPLPTIAAIAGIFLGMPISVVLYLDYLRAQSQTPERADSNAFGSLLLRLPAVLFGSLSILIGATIILWVLYNTFISRLPQYTGPSLFAGFGIGPALIAFGLKLVRTPPKRLDSRSPTSGCS
jgi:hypothetical protein